MRPAKVALKYTYSYRHLSGSALADREVTPHAVDSARSVKRSSLISTSTSSVLIEKLPKSSAIRNVPTHHPDYAATLSYSQLQYLESAQYDVAVHDGNGNLLLKDQCNLPQFGKYGIQNVSENEIFEWIKQTEHLYRETYRDLMCVDPDLIPKDKEKHLLKFPFHKNDFFEQTQLDKNEIASWNLLLRVQSYQSHKEHLETTTDGAINRRQSFMTVLETFREIQNIDSCNIDCYNTMLYAMACHKEPNMCIELLREMGNYGINPSQQSYICLLKSFVNKKQIREAHDILSYMRANTESTSHKMDIELYNIIISGYLKLYRKHEALKVFDTMMQIDGIHPNIKTYTIMMDYYRQTKNTNGAIDLLRECQDRGYKANQITYNAVILAAAYGDIEDHSYTKMFRIFDEMVITKEIPPTADTFAHLIIGCGNIGDIETATKCLHLMDKMGIKRTPKVYKNYLKAIANTLRTRNNFIQIGSTRKLKTNDLIQLSEGIIKKMESDPELLPQIDINIVNALLSVYTSARTINRCMLFYRAIPIRFTNVDPNRHTLRLLWKALIKSRRYHDAQYILNIFKENENNNKIGFGVVKAHMYREMIRLASYYGDTDGVIKYLNMMKDRGLNVRSRDRAYLAVIDGTKAEQLEARRRFAVESRKRKKDVTIRKKAKCHGIHGKEGLSFRYWNRERRWHAEKAAGLNNNQPKRSVGKIHWTVNRTLGQLDDPW